jgi:PiT family inorganic phosphate transporter
VDFSYLTVGVALVLLSVLAAEAANGWTDAPCGTSAAVASGVLSSRTALWLSAVGNFVGLIVALFLGAAVAKTIGTGIVRHEVISVPSIGVAMVTTVIWSASAAWLGLPVSKTHSLLAALAGIGYAQGGLDALLPASGNWRDSGWVLVATGAFTAVMCGSAFAWFLASVVKSLELHKRLPMEFWRRMQIVTVCGVTSGHGFNDGLKYVGIFTLVLFKAGMISEFRVLPQVIVLCALVMAAGTLLGGWRIHHRLDTMVNHRADEPVEKKTFKPYMGVCAELTTGALIWQTGFLGVPTSTTHSTVSAMAGAKSASVFSENGNGEVKTRVHISSLIRILWGWIVTYLFCFAIASKLASWSL